MESNHEVWVVCLNCGKEYDGRRLVCDSCGCAGRQRCWRNVRNAGCR